MEPFVHSSIASRVIFGHGSSGQLLAEINLLGKKTPFMVCTKSHRATAEALCTGLGMQRPAIFSDAIMHTPVNVTLEAVAIAQSANADVLVSLGGGSAIGLGKAISERLHLPHICIPTTYAGSEMTAILGETENGVKKTHKNPSIQPATVIYDVRLTMSLPLAISANSGMNAIAHAVEALWAKSKSPVITLIALEGVRALASSLPEIVTNPSSEAARSTAQYGAWLCSVCLGTVGGSLHHKLCHTIGGSFGMPHAETHAIILPHMIAYNNASCSDAMKRLADVLPGSDGDAILGIVSLQQKLGIVNGLKDYGFGEDDIQKAAQIAASNLCYNVRPYDETTLARLIARAWAGKEPDRSI